MKVTQLFENKSYLYEGLDSSALRTVKLWESVGRQIVEADLTANQIQQLFQQVEKDSTAAGGNRTLLGKGKDVGGAVKSAYDDLVSKVQNSGPMKDIDAKYDQAAEKLKQATGGDNGVMKYVEKYRKFAKEHPIAQSLIYSALIAAAGISGVGAGGAAALGLLKMTDKLLQGEKFSTAVGKGIATGATAFAAGQVGKALQGGDQVPGSIPGSKDVVQWSRNGIPFSANVDHGKVIGDIVFAGQTISPTDPNYAEAAKAFLSAAGKEGMLGATKDIGGAAASFSGFKSESILQSKNLSILEVRAVIGSVAIVEGDIWNAVKSGAKGVAGAVADKAKTVGHNLTTKVTADKLQSAWTAAGSPTDSEAVKQIITGTGVDAGVVDKVYAELQIPTNTAPPADAQPADATQSPPADAQPADATQSPPANAQQTPGTQPSSTGGTITKTPTGQIHTANPNNPNQPSPPADAQPTPTTTQTQPSGGALSKVGNFIKGIPAAITGAAGSAVGGFVGGMKRGYQSQATENIENRLSVTDEGNLQFESKFLGKKI